MISYRTIAEPVEVETEAKRSRFRCRLVPVSEEAAARAEIEAIRKLHWDAGHHCVAFVLGTRGETERSSDDGEPAGTAGAPMLEALRGAGLTEVLAVVTRWFGGTLLGTGGLVRAYGDAVRQAIALASVRTVRQALQVTVTLDPMLAGKVEAGLRRRGVDVVDSRWSARVELDLGVAPDDLEATLAEVAALTGGTASAAVTGERWVVDETATPA